MSKKLLLSSILSVAVIGLTLGIVMFGNDSFIPGHADECHHEGRFWHNEVSQASETAPGTRDYYACCDCHDAFISHSEYGVGTKIGNTVTDRSKLDVYDIKWDSSLIALAKQAETIMFRKDDSTSGTLCGETTNDKIYYNYNSGTKTLDVFASCAIRFKDNDRISDDEGYFYGCSNATSISLQNVDTSSATYFYTTFAECTSLVTIDISSVDTHKATDIGRMFYNCQNLVTVYASTLFTNSTATYKGSVFYECRKIVGGEGTTYESTGGMIGGDYACIDRIQSKGRPGYFTLKESGTDKQKFLNIYRDYSYILQNGINDYTKEDVTSFVVNGAETAITSFNYYAASETSGRWLEISFEYQSQPVSLNFGGGTLAYYEDSTKGVKKFIAAREAEIEKYPEEHLGLYYGFGENTVTLATTRDGNITTSYTFNSRGHIVEYKSNIFHCVVTYAF